MKTKLKLRAVVALTTILVMANLIMVAGIAVLMFNIDISKSLVTYTKTQNNRLYYYSCLEEGLFRIKQDNSYIGTIILTQSPLTCDIVVTNSAQSGYKDLQITVTDGVTYFLQTNRAQITTSGVILVG